VVKRRLAAPTDVRILYHHRTLADGAEGIHIHGMVDAFRALGHGVAVHAITRPRAPGEGDAGRLARIRARLPQAAFEAGVAALNGPEFLHVARLLRGGADLLYKRHALLDVGALAAAKRRRVPSVLEVNFAYSAEAVRSFEPVRLTGLVRRAERAALRLATVIVAVSTPLADCLRGIAQSDLPILVLPNGVDPELFDPDRHDGRDVRARYGLDGRFVVGWAGLLRRWHEIDVLLDALVQAPAAHLLMIGDGPDRAEIERMGRERGLADRLRITGRVPHSEMPSHLSALDVAVAAGDHTGFASPMKVVEYMAMARAPLLPRLRNFEDLVDDDRTGLFFEPRSASDLARLIRLTAGSPAVRERIGRAARHEVVTRLNWRDNARAVIESVSSNRLTHPTTGC
jgi:glycosyltransferase involved in cell wall biosynthesis